jgi:VWFA-related protein
MGDLPRFRTGKLQYKLLYLTILMLISFLPIQICSVFSQQDTLQVSFDFISISDTLIFRKKQASFPHPVISILTVKDQMGSYVHGLANPDEWIGPDDTTQTGVLVDDIWKVIFEYHEEDPLIPSNPNVKLMSPEYMVTYLVTELIGLDGYGASIAMVMDYSGSMKDDIYIAEDAAKSLVRKTSKHDHVAIYKFAGSVQLYQDFTNDTTLLMEALDRPFENRANTWLYDALYESITLSLDQGGRTAVVAYTDGYDNARRGKKIDEVIEYAKQNYVPIFMIGLGDKTEEAPLQRLAQETGGVYFTAPSVEDIGSIYISIYNILQGYYLLAHMSTDTLFNGTWRIVDLEINHQGAAGKAKGKYYVPHIPNISVSKNIETDSTLIVSGDTLHYAMVGDTVNYNISVYNKGKGTAFNVDVVDVYADSLELIDFETSPVSVIDDSIFWQIPKIDSGKSVKINYRVRIKKKLPMGKTELINKVRVDCQFDSLTIDNEDQALLNALSLPDFTVRLFSSETVSSPGYKCPLFSIIENNGNGDATESFKTGFVVEMMGPDPVTTYTFSELDLGDSLRSDFSWIFNQEGIYKIKVNVDIDDEIVELNEKNNWDSIYVEVGIDSIRVYVSDFSLNEEIRSIKGEFPQYVLTYINVLDQNKYSIHGLADTSQWLLFSDNSQIGKPVNEIWQNIREYHQEDSLYPVNSDVRGGMKITEITNATISVVLMLDFSAFYGKLDSVLKKGLTDFIRGFQGSDWGTVVGLGDTLEVIEPFTQDRTRLEAALKSSFSSDNRLLYDGLYSGITLSQTRSGRNGILTIVGGNDEGSFHNLSEVIVSSQENGVPVFILHVAEDGMSESLESLCIETGGMYYHISNSDNVEKMLNIFDGFLRNYYVLCHTSSDTIQNNTFRVVDVMLSAFELTGQDAGVYRAPYGIIDVAIEKDSKGKYPVVANNDTISWYSQPGDSIYYTLTLNNFGHWDVQNVVIEDTLPVNVIPENFSIDPEIISGNIVRWSIDTIKIDETIQLDYGCYVDTLEERKPVNLINKVVITCENDSILSNNFAQDTVLYEPLQNGDISIIKQGIGDSIIVSKGDSVNYVHAGNIIEYRVTLTNQGERICRDISVQDILPEWVTLVDFSPNSFELNGDSLTWTVNQLASRGGSVSYTYKCRVDTLMPPEDFPLENFVRTYCKEDTVPANNTDQDTIMVFGTFLPGPQVQVTPTVIEPRDTIQVQVMTVIPAISWDLEVIFEDESIIDSYADDFIQNNDLLPGSWYPVIPDFMETRMRTDRKKEKVGVIINTWDLWNVLRSDTAYFTIQSADKFYLEENIFRPRSGRPLGMRFKLSSNRKAELTIYDIAGGFVRKIADSQMEAGWVYFTWDGQDNNGNNAGSGIYIAILSSSGYQQIRKFILIR